MLVHALTSRTSPSLHVWRDPSDGADSFPAWDVVPLVGAAPSGNGAGPPFRAFEVPVDYQLHQHLHCLLHEGASWELPEHRRTIPRVAHHRFPQEVWIVDGTSRVLLDRPPAPGPEMVKIHLITARKYRNGRLYLWLPGRAGRYLDRAGDDAWGPYFTVTLEPAERRVFAFKFVDEQGGWEPDYANKLWAAADGGEVWVHSRGAAISTTAPARKTLAVHFLGRPAAGASLHLWQEDSDFAVDLPGVPEAEGWLRFETSLYTGRPYRFLFRLPGRRGEWEHEEAKREVRLDGDREVWTLEGDRELFAARPAADRRVILEVGGRTAERPPDGLSLDVWVNRGELSLASGVGPTERGTFEFDTYPDIVTSFRFRRDGAGERIERHYLKIEGPAAGPVRRWVVLDRPDAIPAPPVEPLFQDPPFLIERPGAWVRDGRLRFALHAPTAASVQVIGDFTGWNERPLPMRSTRDGAYWWAEVPVSDVLAAISGDTIHGSFYKFLLNGIQPRQDPAADWVESSSPDAASKLVDHSRFAWSDGGWRRPGWEYLIVYQIHPARFSGRFAGAPLERVRKEVEELTGYLRSIGSTAVLLMPVNEFAGDRSWGYNPAFFYAVESSYGGPDALKALVDACHRNGLAVLLDVVFNHAGTSDNILWSIARESFFQGDTAWGAMIRFDHPQVIHFFEQNLAYLMRMFHLDGFRFDATWVIRHGGQRSWPIVEPGSGGGWQFLHRLRAAVQAVDPRCVLMAEHLPNEWDLTRYGGPMDTQWCDGYHDRLVEACRGWGVMPALADALKITHTSCNQWYEATNYPESHDEVGNVPDRIVNVAGLGQGLRRNKVAAAATLASRGIPMWFMGAEAGEWRQFGFDGADTLDIPGYLSDPNSVRMRKWWRSLCDLRRGNPGLEGASPLDVRFCEESCLAFSRGAGGDYFVVLNFGPGEKRRGLWEMNLGEGSYREQLNSTWPDYAVESEPVQDNGGGQARLGRGDLLRIPAYGAVVLQRVG